MTKKHSQKPAILFVGTQMAVGGAQNLLLSQADWFHTRGYSVTAAFLYDRDGLCAKWQAQFPFPIVDLKMRIPANGWMANGIRLISGLFSFSKLIRQGVFSVVLAYTQHANLVALPLAWLNHVPVRIATHLGQIRDLSWLVECLHTSLVNTGIASRLVAASSNGYDQSVKEGIRPSRLEVIRNGIPPVQVDPAVMDTCRRTLGMGATAFLLVTAGRLVEEKGHADLIRSMPKVLSQFPEARLALVGYGSFEPTLRQMCHELGISEYVHFLGCQEDVHSWIALADVFVMPSHSEGLPLALLEAMSLGRAIIATRVGGIPEALQEGASGRLVPVNDPQTLAEGIIALLTDSSMRKQLGQSARYRFDACFSLDRMCETYLNLFLRLLRVK